MMRVKYGLLGAALLVLTIVVGVSAQNPPAPAPQAPAPAGGAPRGGGRQATFPGQQRPPGDPVVSARGKALYEMNCQTCHAADLRGATGPNLLRSQAVLSDQNGELLAPIVKGSLPNMKAIPLNDQDIVAIAVYLHDVVRTARGQGAPPTIGVPVTNYVVGDAAAGQRYFQSKCASCHSTTADLQGIGGRMPDARTLQNLWVSGGVVGGSRGRAGAPDTRTPTVTVTLSASEKVEGRLVKIDDFLVTLTMADGSLRSFRRQGDQPKVDVKDPIEPHRALWRVLTDKDMHDVTAYLVTLK